MRTKDESSFGCLFHDVGDYLKGPVIDFQVQLPFPVKIWSSLTQEQKKNEKLPRNPSLNLATNGLYYSIVLEKNTFDSSSTFVKSSSMKLNPKTIDA